MIDPSQVPVRRNRLRVAEVPPPRPPAKLPPPRSVGAVPGGQPKGHKPTVHIAVAPVERPVGKVPNPRRLKPVRDVNGGALGDLFAIFPDLPRPGLPPVRKPRTRPVVRLVRRR
jgi:hypothetical protein